MNFKPQHLKSGVLVALVLVFVGILSLYTFLQSTGGVDEVRDVAAAQVNIAPEVLAEVDFAALKQQVVRKLGKHVDRYGVRVYDLKRRQGFSINGGMVLPPASLSKVPVAILALRDIQAGKLTYDQTYPIKNRNKPYSHDRMAQYSQGKKVTLRKYLRYSIIYSDNTANATLEDILGGRNRVNARISKELGVNPFFRIPHLTTANSVGKVFIKLYNGDYLQGEHLQFMLDALFNTASHLQDGIPAKLPQEAKVAHKTGQLPFHVWEDAGIVYGTKTDFAIAFVNKGITYSSARKRVQEISRLIYDELN